MIRTYHKGRPVDLTLEQVSKRPELPKSKPKAQVQQQPKKRRWYPKEQKPVESRHRLMTWGELADMPGRWTQPNERWTSIVYALLDPRDKRVHYVGVTSQTLAERLQGHLAKPTNSEMQAWIEQLRSKGLEPHACVITYAPPAHAEALELEWISKIRVRARLLNQDPGGRYRDSEGKPKPVMKRIAGMVKYQAMLEHKTGSMYFRGATFVRQRPGKTKKFKWSKDQAATSASHRHPRRALATPLWGKSTESKDTAHDPANSRPRAGTIVQPREAAQATILRRRNGQIRALSPNTSSALASDPDKVTA